jgi:hypothetical protein
MEGDTPNTHHPSSSTIHFHHNERRSFQKIKDLSSFIKDDKCRKRAYYQYLRRLVSLVGRHSTIAPAT